MNKNINQRDIEVKQSLVDFSEVAKLLRVNKDMFNYPNRVLDLLEGRSDISVDVKNSVEDLLGLGLKLKDLGQRYVDAGFGFQNSKGKLARNITDYAYEFSEEQVSDLQELPGLIKKFYEDRVELLQNNPEIRELFGINDLDIVSKLQVPLFTRLDMVEGPDGKLQLVEIEPIYAGLGETMGTRDIYNDINKVDPNFVGMQESYLKSLGRLSGKRVLYCPNPKLSGYFSEVEYLFNQLNNGENNLASLDLTLDVNSLDFREDGVYFQGSKIDVLMNYFIPKEQYDDSELDNQILDQFKKGNIELFPEPSLELDSKLWLALAGDERYFDDRELYDKFIPNTKIYEPGEDYSGDKMLKRISSNINKNDFFDTSNGYDSVTIETDSKPWIVQDKLDNQTKEVVLMNRKGKIEKMDMYSRIEVYLFFPEDGAELGDILVTMSPRQIVKGGRDCVMVPGKTKK